MKRVNKKDFIGCSSCLLMVCSMLRLLVEFLISLFETLQVLLEFLIEYKDILYAQFLVN